MTLGRDFRKIHIFERVKIEVCGQYALCQPMGERTKRSRDGDARRNTMFLQQVPKQLRLVPMCFLSENRSHTCVPCDVNRNIDALNV